MYKRQDHELLFQLINLWSDYKPVLQALYDFIVACYNAVSELFAKEECGLIRNLLRICLLYTSRCV